MNKFNPLNKARQLASMEVPDVIRNTVKASAETLTGILKSEPRDFFVTLGYIAQRLIADEHLDSVLTEWENLRKKGRIKDDYSQTK